MAYTQTDKERREEQEQKDFSIFKTIINDLFNGKKFKIEKQKDGTSHDARLTGYTSNGGERHYCIELKWQNNIEYNIREYGGAYLKLDKLFYMKKDKRNDEKSIVVYICNDGTYYLFDIDQEFYSKQITELNTRTINLLDSQYYKDGCNYKKWQWCVILPINKAKIQGRWQK